MGVGWARCARAMSMSIESMRNSYGVLPRNKMGAHAAQLAPFMSTVLGFHLSFFGEVASMNPQP